MRKRSFYSALELAFFSQDDLLARSATKTWNEVSLGGASAIDPVASMQAIENAELTALAGEVRDLLAKAVDEI